MNAQDLRNSILQLAVQGQLVEQSPEEGTAKELLGQIRAEKGRLIKEKKIKKEQPLPEIAEDEIPFEIPESWEWVRLIDIGEVVGGGTPKTSETAFWENGDIPWLTPADMRGLGKYISCGERRITHEGLKSSSARLMPSGTVIYSSRAPIGYIGIALNELCTNQGFKSLVPFDTGLSEYLYYCLIARTQNIISRASGTTFKEISGSEFGKTVIPLPPLSEQKRIVAKIEEVLPYIEQYDKAHTKLEVFNKKFPEDMKKSILQLAMQGKLVEQCPEEGTADELCEQIAAEKARLVKAGKIKAEKPLSEIGEDEIPFEIPKSWKWMRLGDISTYGQSKEKIVSKDIELNTWVLDLEDIEKDTGRIVVKNKAEQKKITGDRVKFKKNDILYSKLRPYLLKILVAPEDGVCTPEIVPFRLFGDIDVYYVMFMLKSPHVNYLVNAESYGTKMPRVGTNTMLNLLIPLPPIEEQRRIVAKIEEILPYCEQLIK